MTLRGNRRTADRHVSFNERAGIREKGDRRRPAWRALADDAERAAWRDRWSSDAADSAEAFLSPTTRSVERNRTRSITLIRVRSGGTPQSETPRRERAPRKPADAERASSPGPWPEAQPRRGPPGRRRYLCERRRACGCPEEYPGHLPLRWRPALRIFEQARGGYEVEDHAGGPIFTVDEDARSVDVALVSDNLKPQNCAVRHRVYGCAADAEAASSGTEATCVGSGRMPH